jgi:hypothetical protein
MNYQEALEKLERLLDGYKKAFIDKSDSVSIEDLCMLYGELEEVIHRFAGKDTVVVQSRYAYEADQVYPNYIAAPLFSGHESYVHAGYTQLLKLIGKVRQYAEDPSVPQVEHSVTSLLRILHRFRECCQYLSFPLQSEPDVQTILWVMLRSHFDRLEKEETLPRFGVKSYRPDFGIPDLRVLIEAKFVGAGTDVGRIQDGLLGDIPGYLNETTHYDSVVIFVYDAGHKLLDPTKFIEDLRSVEGIIDVIVVPSVG